MPEATKVLSVLLWYIDLLDFHLIVAPQYTVLCFQLG